jgi:hypothetical protein
VHDPNRPTSFVLTTYFDTVDHRLFASSRSVAQPRVRLRQYAGAASDDATPVLSGICAFEVKLSIFESRRITRVVDTADRVDGLLDERIPIGRRLDGEHALPRAARAVRSGALRPVLTSYFRRRSYGARGIRVTIDDRIVYTRPARLGRPGQPARPEGAFHRSPHVVVEVKLSADPPPWLTDAMRLIRRGSVECKFHEGMRAQESIDVLATAAASHRGLARVR